MGIETLIKEALIEQGIEKGIGIGMEKGTENTIFILFSKGFTVEQVSEMTNFELRNLN